MNKPMILHHYDASPYAEKIRLMFGLTNARWQSLLAPVQPPRPSLDPLAGGYRRIPVLQVGADIFCDSALIAKEVAAATQNPALDPANADETTAAIMEQAETRAFFAAVGAVPPMRLIGTMLLKFGPVGAYHFIKDRAGLMKGGTARPAQGEAAKSELASLLSVLDARLSASTWVGGSEPSVADFSAYHPLWLHVNCSRRPLTASAKVKDWYQRIGEIGHGQREDITQEQAFAAARDADPRALPGSIDNPPVAIGSVVDVAPSDYGVVPVTGTLLAITDERIILSRDTSEFGQVHIHFPRVGYSIVAQAKRG